MGSLDRAQALLAAGQDIALRRGVITLDTGATVFGVNVDGVTVPADFVDTVGVNLGDPVLVALIESHGQSAAVVLGRLTSPAPRPAFGKVTATGTKITVLGSDGSSYSCYPLGSYTAAVNDPVLLLWQGGFAYALGKTAAQPFVPLANPVQAPPPDPATGTDAFPASDSSTFLGSWDGWGDVPGRVFQGDGGGGSTTGAWFYAGTCARLSTMSAITRLQLTLGPRAQVGGYGSPVDLQVYTHSSATRPGGNVTLVSGPATVTIQPWQGVTTYDLPLSFATDLLNGGGIAITGGTYAGVQGIGENASSGLLTFTWSR